MQRVPLLLLLLLAASSGGRARAAAPGSASDPDWLEYVKFLSEHRPNAAERRRLNSHSSTRLAIFKANLRRLEDQQRCDPGATYGVNMFTDLSEEEFNSMYVSGHQHWNETIAKYRASGETGHTPGVATNFTYRRQLSGGSIDWNALFRVSLVPFRSCHHSIQRAWPQVVKRESIKRLLLMAFWG